MAIRRKQKVVLREKVRQQRRLDLRIGFWRGLKYILFLSVALFFSFSLYNLLFRSDFFMLKFIEVNPSDTKTSKTIAGELSQQLGRSIFSFSAQRLEKNLQAKLPAVRALNLRRSFPNRVEARYEMREPIAQLENGRQLLDADAAVFSADDLSAGLTAVTGTAAAAGNLRAALPELTFVSTITLPTSLSFVKMWSQSRSQNLPSFSTGSVRKVAVDETGEIVLLLDEPDLGSGWIKIVWGNFDAQTFSEKFDRLQRVCADLRAKTMKVQYVNLRDVPQKTNSALSDRSIVGRVIVRPIPAEKSGSPTLKKKGS